MKTIELKNSFHGTSIRISDRWGGTAGEAWYNLMISAERGDRSAKRTARRVRNALCGAHDCKCGVVR